ncbi:MAG: endonuclease V [Euryarchaeota archaeon]|nr:endonuclease V [Euryarchaeota archaeon]
MTRINLVDPKELTQQHLVAEYREIFMVGSSLQRSLRSPNWHKTKETLPKEFTLNGGHVKFFYNKGKYLHNRYLELVKEMKRRGMKPDPTRTFKKEQWPNELYKNWTPNNKAIQIIRQRINERIKQKPNWYKFYE